MAISRKGGLLEYSTETLRADQLDDLHDLHKMLMPRKRGLNARYLEWKYLENPYIQDPLILAIRSGSEVIATTGFMGMVWPVGPDKVPTLVPQVDDLIIHPDFRRKGLIAVIDQNLQDLSLGEGYPAMIALSGGRNSNTIALARSWSQVRELVRLYLVRGERPVPKSSQIPGVRTVASKSRGLAKRLGYSNVGPPSDEYIDPLMEPVNAAISPVSVSAATDFNELSELATRVNPSGSSRSPERLRWRLSNPDRTYRYLTWRDDRLRGYLVLSWAGEDHRRVRIADHGCETDSIFSDLLTALAQIPSGDVELMISTLPESRIQTAQDIGFQPDPEFVFKQRRFIIRPVVAEGERPEDSPIYEEAASWHVDLIDTLHG